MGGHERAGRQRSGATSGSYDVLCLTSFFVFEGYWRDLHTSIHPFNKVLVEGGEPFEKRTPLAAAIALAKEVFGSLSAWHAKAERRYSATKTMSIIEL